MLFTWVCTPLFVCVASMLWILSNVWLWSCSCETCGTSSNTLIHSAPRLTFYCLFLLELLLNNRLPKAMSPEKNVTYNLLHHDSMHQINFMPTESQYLQQCAWNIKTGQHFLWQLYRHYLPQVASKHTASQCKVVFTKLDACLHVWVCNWFMAYMYTQTTLRHEASMDSYGVEAVEGTRWMKINTHVYRLLSTFPGGFTHIQLYPHTSKPLHMFSHSLSSMRIVLCG